MAAKATRFCFRTVRTKPWTVSVLLADVEGGEHEEVSLNSAAIVGGAVVEECTRRRLCDGRQGTRV